MQRHLLFIPTYNCQKQIVRVLQTLTTDSAQWFEQILVIDNRSSDDTLNACKMALSNHPLSSKIVVVRNLENAGLGGTHKNAFDFAIERKFDYVTILHGDDQGSLTDFQEIFSSLDGQSSYLGARFHPKSALVNYSRLRTAGNILFNVVSSLITGRKIEDLGGSGLNTFHVKSLSKLNYHSYSNDLTFHVYLLLDAVSKRQSIRFIPISWREEDQISNAKVFRQGLKLLKILMKFLLGQHSQVAAAPRGSKGWEIIAGKLPEKLA